MERDDYPWRGLVQWTFGMDWFDILRLVGEARADVPLKRADNIRIYP